ncbi:MAG: hypothetical protein EU541_02255 [Promethearchaeota archaeon]|nr:MAG: hypothetical protein EU541_02255 [Candidatus Lokiarchaeota archaeon]
MCKEFISLREDVSHKREMLELFAVAHLYFYRIGVRFPFTEERKSRKNENKDKKNKKKDKNNNSLSFIILYRNSLIIC